VVAILAGPVLLIGLMACKPEAVEPSEPSLSVGGDSQAPIPSQGARAPATTRATGAAGAAGAGVNRAGSGPDPEVPGVSAPAGSPQPGPGGEIPGVTSPPSGGPNGEIPGVSSYPTPGASGGSENPGSTDGTDGTEEPDENGEPEATAPGDG
jgi:hypothetical protein